jgi:hypothetical protein
MKTNACLIAYVLALALQACSRPANQGGQPRGDTPKEAEIEQLVLFGHSFINYAWGYQNRGWFIDRDGYMKAYRVAEPESWHRIEMTGPDSGSYIQEALEANYAKAEKAIYRIPQMELHEKYSLIAAAVGGPYSNYRRTAYDAGAVQFSAFLLDQDRGMYRQVLLSLSGDFSQENRHPDAIALDRWLKSLNQIYADSLAAEP